MIRSKVVFCVAIVLPFLSLIAIPKAAAQSNKCEAGIGNWSYRLTDPYIKKTFPTPELRLQGISNWGELRQVGDIARRSERCDSPHHKFKVVSGVSMVMPGVFVSGVRKMRLHAHQGAKKTQRKCRLETKLALQRLP